MRWVATIRLRFRSIFFRNKVEQELDEELHYHLERQTEEFVAAGMPYHDARLAALRSIADIEQRKEECRDTRRVRWLEDLAADLRHAVRCWLRAPAFAAAAIVTLALGIGANTTVFSLVDALLLRPIPVVNPYRLVRIGSLEDNGKTFSVPGPLLDDLRREPLIEGVCGVQTPVSTVSLDDTVFPVSTHALTGDCYRTLGVRAVLGRLFTPSDDLPNAAPVAVLSYAFWRDKFGSNPDVLGQTIGIEGVPFTIIGVTEPQFHGLLLGFPPGISFPISQLSANKIPGLPRPFYWAYALARMKPGVTPQEVRAKLGTEWRRLLDAALPLDRFKGAQRDELLRMPPVVNSGASGLDYFVRDRFRQPLAGLLAISALVLLVACTNVANLLFARGLQRRPEIALRLALGAKRGRIARQLLSESALLVICGFATALLLSSLGNQILLSLLNGFDAGMSIEADLDGRILIFAAGSGLVSLLFGVLPAWQTSDLASATTLRAASRSGKGRRSGTRRILIIGQVALTMILVAGASLFIATLQRLKREPLGFATREILDVQLAPMPGSAVPKTTALAYFTDFLYRIRNLPGVEDASLSTFSPLFTLPYKEDIRRLDRPDQTVLQASEGFVSDGFLRTMGISLLQGHDFTPTDGTASQKTAIVSSMLAKRLFPEGNVLGRHIRFGSEPETRDLEIVGVAADARLEDPRGKDLSFLYLNFWQLPDRGNRGTLQLRHYGSTAALITALRTELGRDGHQYTNQIRSLSEQYELSLLQERLLAALGASFGLLALTLAAVGLFGLLSFFVATRTGEIGIRIALGAERWRIFWMVIREACILVGTGILISLPLCYADTRILSRLVYGTPAVPVVPLILSSLVLVIVTASATLIPAYRASSVDPITALKYE